MSEPLKIVARIIAATGAADRLETEMRRLVAETRQEHGCLQYELNRGTENSDVFVFVEEWESRALWEAHMAGTAIRDFNARIADGDIASGEILQLRTVV